ncbi:hypothetical protein [Aeromicrobium ginsengisoli]|uniref:Uncharacterized protein n=1 Tax=Aeromicrobium ginsengisoli TaxID=363867 RepID=A0A5M4FF61_9ACTN|nr:hypothetical protein [Aeromicrobium ginsengisoli]KAA1397850.1 hypothetical protein ESP70_010935 [Aeromicrobium ginsengisoli]
MFFVNRCDELEILRSILDRVADQARLAGLDARIGLVRSQYSPLSAHLPPGFVAGLSIRGRTIDLADGIEGPEGTSWRADPDAVEAVIEHALNWCAVAGGEDWFWAGLSTFKVTREQRRDILVASVRAGQSCGLDSARAVKLSKSERERLMRSYDVDLARTVVFTDDGHVIYGVASDGPPLEWRECVEDLEGVIKELHAEVDYAMVQRRNVTPGLWRELHRDIWRPWIKVHPDVLWLDRDEECRRIVNAYGIQLVGPAHRPIPSAGRWVTQDLGAGKVLVTDRDLEPWFAMPPTFELYASAREDLTDLLANPTWKPLRDNPAT